MLRGLTWTSLRKRLTAHPFIPVLMSAVLPGLGQAVRGRYRKALLIAGAAALFTFLPSPIGPLAQIGVWVYSVVDAYEG